MSPCMFTLTGHNSYIEFLQMFLKQTYAKKINENILIEKKNRMSVSDFPMDKFMFDVPIRIGTWRC